MALAEAREWGDAFSSMGLLRPVDEKHAVLDSPLRRVADLHVLLEAIQFPTDDAALEMDPILLSVAAPNKGKTFFLEYASVSGRRYPAMLNMGGVHTFLFVNRTRTALIDTATKEAYQWPLGFVSGGEFKPSGELFIDMANDTRLKLKFKTSGSKLTNFALNVAAIGFETYEDSRARDSRSPKGQYLADVHRRTANQKQNGYSFMEVLFEFVRRCASLPLVEPSFELYYQDPAAKQSPPAHQVDPFSTRR